MEVTLYCTSPVPFGATLPKGEGMEKPPFPEKRGRKTYLTYSLTTRRLGSVPVEWVVMLSISCREAWITWRS